MSNIKGVNSYSKQLSTIEIEKKLHRSFVGGLWDEIGDLQLNFLKKQGLKPDHKLLDIGCGSLRGGVKFISYLNKGNYYGIDINKSLIEAGKLEIKEANLAEKEANLIVDDKFSIDKFNERFEFMLSVSLFTHLNSNIIIRCLKMARESLTENGRYFTTFFEAPYSAHIKQIKQTPDGIYTNYDSDPFHYSKEELEYIALIAELNLEIIGDWGHPRNQKMAAFSLKK